MEPSPNIRYEAFRVIDNFCPRWLDVRQSFYDSGFGTWMPPKGDSGHANYRGMNFHGKHSLMIAALVASTGAAVFPNTPFARLTDDESDTPFVHSDRNDGAKTCIAYLSEHEGSGTAFFRHRATGWTRMPPVEWMRQTYVSQLTYSRPDAESSALANPPASWLQSSTVFDALWKDMQTPTAEVWQQMDSVCGIANRALIFDAALFHARQQIPGISPDDQSKGRLVWVCHYHLPATVDNQP